jgi:hypothetical protein
LIKLNTWGTADGSKMLVVREECGLAHRVQLIARFETRALFIHLAVKAGKLLAALQHGMDTPGAVA